MARDITSGFETEIEASTLRPIIMMHAAFDSGDLRFWTGIGELTYDSETWTGSGDLLKMEPVTESQSLSANGVAFELSGIPASLVAIALLEHYQGRTIEAFFGVLDEDFALIADPYKVFSGFMDVMDLSDDGETATITVNCESDLVILKESGERRYTPEDQKQDYANDLGLDFVPIIQDIELAFGAGRED
jgi:hypothetical protein